MATHRDYRAGDPGFGDPVPCACGCGVLLRPLDGYKRERHFIRGHWIKWALKSYQKAVEEYVKRERD